MKEESPKKPKRIRKSRAKPKKDPKEISWTEESKTEDFKTEDLVQESGDEKDKKSTSKPKRNRKCKAATEIKVKMDL